MAIRIGTRGSMLALVQARLVAGLLGEGEIVVVDAHPRAQDGKNARAEDAAPLSGESVGPAGGDKSRWVGRLERALLADEVDLAVHSAKDVPGDLSDGLELLGTPPRAPVEDTLVGARSLDELPLGACVGTSSVRRAAQLRAARGDVEVVDLHGNVDTRLRKLAQRTVAKAPLSQGGRRPRPAGAARREGQGVHGRSPAQQAPLDAIVLARAGLVRLGRERDIGCVLPPARFVPAPGQGMLALQARAGDGAVQAIVQPILDHDASCCLLAERAVAHNLGASCNTPLGAWAVPVGRGRLSLRVWIGLLDGSQWLSDDALGDLDEPEALGRAVAERLAAVGARDLLARAEESAIA